MPLPTVGASPAGGTPLRIGSTLLRLGKVPFFGLACLGRPHIYYFWKEQGIRLLARCGRYERRAMKVLLRSLPPGGWALDVGGHFGAYTRSFLRAVGPTGGVIVLEPFQPVARRLQRTLGRFPNCRVLPVAASDRTGLSMWINVPRLFGIVPEPALAHLTLQPGRPCSRMPPFPVTTLALDDLIGDLPRLDVVKIDTEGHEIQVLAGARKLLSRYRPLVQFEEHHMADRLADYLAIAEKLHYRVAVADRDERLRELADPVRGPGEFYLVPHPPAPSGAGAPSVN